MLAFSARVGDSYDVFTWEIDKFGNTVGAPSHLTTSEASEDQPAWSPDGKQIAYVWAKPPEYGLYVMNADGSVQRKVADLTKETYRITSPTWSSDSQQVAYCKDGELWLAPVAGGEAKKIAGDAWYPAWSPDGRYIAAFVRQPASGLVFYGPDGKLVNTLVRFVDQFGQIAWSSDGKELVFTAVKVGEEKGALWTIPADGNRPKPLRAYGQVHGYVSRAPLPGVMVAERPPVPAVTTAPPPVARTPAVKPPVTRAVTKPATKPGTTKPPTRVEVVSPPPPLPALPGPEGPVRIVSPADGAKIRGEPTLVAAKDNKEGYVMFEVKAPGQIGGDFQWATVSPFQWQWDTRLLPDGEYALSAIGFDGAGQREGRAEVKVLVENGLPSSRLGDQGTLFRLRLNPNEIWEKKVRASVAFVGNAPENLRQLTGTLDATMTQKVEMVTRDGTSATVVTRIQEASLSLGGVSTPLAEGARSARVTVTPLGKFIPPASFAARHRIGLGELYVTLPQQRVKVGDSWTAPMTYMAELVAREVREVAAHHRISELKWQNEMETAHIVSTVSWPQIPLGGGLQLNNVSVKRDTWFAYKQGKILRMEDTITARLSGAPPAGMTPAVTPRAMMAPPAGSEGLREVQFQQEERRGGLLGSIRLRPPSTLPPGFPAPGTRPSTTVTPTTPLGPALDLTYTFTLVSELAE
jgi:hypothetical protein